MKVGIFVVGLFTVAQFSFWGNYLPRVYPVHLRGTGEGFAANIGGRMIGTSMAYVVNKLAGALGAADPTLDAAAKVAAAPANMAYAAATVAAGVLLIGAILSFFLPGAGIGRSGGIKGRSPKACGKCTRLSSTGPRLTTSFPGLRSASVRDGHRPREPRRNLAG